MAGISTVNAKIATNLNWQAGNNLTGSAYGQVQESAVLAKAYNFGTANANGASGGGDEVFSFQQTIAGGGSVTINLNNMTNVLQQAGVSIARIKALQIRLLSTSDDSTITAPAASQITVTNNGPQLPNPLDFGNGGSGLTLTLTTAGTAITGVAIGAAGTGYPPSSSFVVTANESGGSGGVLSVTTNSSGVPTSTNVVAGGTGYANGTYASTVLGAYTINSGGTHTVFDVSAAGFVLVSATSQNFKIFNNDAANTATVEITFYAATT
jgi:hypothetical protein